MPDRRMKILLVDDTPDNLVSLEAALNGLGEELVMATSGKDALRHLLHEDFAAILLDVRMPEMDGFETAELIRSRPRSRQTPIIFLTGYKNEEHLFRGYAKLKEQADALIQQAEVLKKAEQKFRALLEAAPDAMVMCREDGRIVMVNSPAEALFHCGREKLISANIRSLVPDWEFQLPRGWDADSSLTKVQPGEVGKAPRAVREDGSAFPLAISFRPLHT